MTMHLSPLTLDAFALDALDTDEAARVTSHLASCATCRAERDAAAALREHFVVQVLPRTQPRSRPDPVQWRRWAWLTVPALAAAVVLLVALPDRSAPRATGIAELGIKGNPAMQVFASRDGGEAFLVRDGARLRAGDRIRFAMVPEGAHYLLVAAVDGAGAVSIYYPYRGARSAAVDGARVELPDSIVLDAAPGPERIYAVFSDEPLAADVVASKLRTIGARGPDAIRRTRTLDIAARAQVSLVFEKDLP